MDKICSKCQMAMVYKPGGIAGPAAKTPGKPYSAFWACSSGDRTHSENINSTNNLEPTPQGTVPQTATQQQVSRPMAKSNEQMIAEAKEDQRQNTLQIVRESCLSSMSRVVAASINHPDNLGKTVAQLTDDLITNTDTLVKYVYDGLVDPSEELPF